MSDSPVDLRPIGPKEAITTVTNMQQQLRVLARSTRKWCKENDSLPSEKSTLELKKQVAELLRAAEELLTEFKGPSEPNASSDTADPFLAAAPVNCPTDAPAPMAPQQNASLAPPSYEESVLSGALTGGSVGVGSHATHWTYDKGQSVSAPHDVGQETDCAQSEAETASRFGADNSAGVSTPRNTSKSSAAPVCTPMEDDSYVMTSQERDSLQRGCFHFSCLNRDVRVTKCRYTENGSSARVWVRVGDYTSIQFIQSELTHLLKCPVSVKEAVVTNRGNSAVPRRYDTFPPPYEAPPAHLFQLNPPAPPLLWVKDLATLRESRDTFRYVCFVAFERPVENVQRYWCAEPVKLGSYAVVSGFKISYDCGKVVGLGKWNWEGGKLADMKALPDYVPLETDGMVNTDAVYLRKPTSEEVCFYEQVKPTVDDQATTIVRRAIARLHYQVEVEKCSFQFDGQTLHVYYRSLGGYLSYAAAMDELKGHVKAYIRFHKLDAIA